MQQDCLSCLFKASPFNVEMRIEEDRICFTATHEKQQSILVAEYSSSTLPARVKTYFETLKELFLFLKENSHRIQCIEGIGLRTYLQISRQNTKQIVIPLQIIVVSEENKLRTLYQQAINEKKVLEVQNQQLNETIRQLRIINQALQDKVKNLQMRLGEFEGQNKQVASRITSKSAYERQRYQKLLKPAKQAFVFEPDTSIIAKDFENKGSTWIKLGHYGALLVNKNAFRPGTSSVNIMINKSKSKAIYVGVLSQFKVGYQPEWAGSKSAFLQIQGGKRAFKDWDEYSGESIEPTNQGQTITITVSFNQSKIFWLRKGQTLCSCFVPGANIYAFVRLKQEGDSITI